MRPTDEKKDKTVILRISEEMYIGIKKRGDNVSGVIRTILRESLTDGPVKDEGNTKSNKFYSARYVKLKQRVTREALDLFEQGKYNELKIVPDEDRENLDFQDLDRMLNIMGITRSKMLLMVRDALEDGVIWFEDGELKTGLTEFESVCEELGLDVEEELRKAEERAKDGLLH